MQMVKRIIGGFFLSILLLWVLAPKQELYFFLEKSLKKQNIIISNETITDTWLGVKITNADVYVNGLKMANVNEFNFNFFFLYAKLAIEGVNINEAFQNMAPKNIAHLEAVYSIINPLEVTLTGEGDFGELNGEVKLMDRNLEIRFPNPQNLETIKKFLKNDDVKGWYYETNY